MKQLVVLCVIVAVIIGGIKFLKMDEEKQLSFLMYAMGVVLGVLAIGTILQFMGLL